MSRLLPLLCLLAACASDKYVRVDLDDGRSFYARSAEIERVDEHGMVEVENVLTGRRMRFKRTSCVVRSASRGEVTRAKGNRFVYGE